jgi:hypothetical protein
VTYDRDEWRRAWGPGDTPDRPAAGLDVDTASDPAETGETSWSGDRAEPGAGESAASGTAGTTAGTATSSLTRYPQPPPDTWDDTAAGPGSPAGSVRPPDTIGTVDAPAKEPRRAVGLVAVLLAALVGGVVGTGATLALVARDDGPSAVSAPAIEVDGDAGGVVPAVAQAVTPSVVRIDVTGAGTAAAPLGGPGRAGPRLGGHLPLGWLHPHQPPRRRRCRAGPRPALQR